MRKVFLDKLPKHKHGSQKDKIKWQESIGMEIRFVCDDIKGSFKIIGYKPKGQFVTIEYNQKEHIIRTTRLTSSSVDSIVGKYNKEYFYKVGEVINNDLLIIKQDNTNDNKGWSRKAYIYECLVCGNKDTIMECNLKKGQKCNVCAGKKIKIGFNDLWTTNPETANLLVDKEIGYRCSKGSHEIYAFQCPECNNIEYKKIKDITKRGYYCPCCSDNMSYPEKFMYNLLIQLNTSFDHDIKLKWSDNKRYDFYIKELNCIIEVHGSQHYLNNGFTSIGGRTLNEEQENDRLKEQLAKENEIKHYIIIDCRKSEKNFIKSNIIESELNELLDLSLINWEQCHEFACKTIVKQISSMWMNDIKSTNEISKALKMSKSTISKYLKQGSDLGWCDYDSKEVMKVNWEKNKIAERVKEISFSYPRIMYLLKSGKVL